METSHPHWEERREPRTAPFDLRTPYEVDYARIVHSATFRRLQGKLQIHDGAQDFHRNRLTHSYEVAQISLGIAQRLRHHEHPEIKNLISDPSIFQTIGLIHDLGHPPAGHAGEEALNAMMREADHKGDIGFEGNAQTLRIIAHLEQSSSTAGANLTRRTMLGALKYPIAYSKAAKGPTPPPILGVAGVITVDHRHEPPKCYYDRDDAVVSWLIDAMGEDAPIVRNERRPSFDAQVMNIADDISYAIADLEDALSHHMIDRAKLEAVLGKYEPVIVEHVRMTMRQPTPIVDDLMNGGRTRKMAIGTLINYALYSIMATHDARFTDPLYAWSISLRPPAEELISDLKRLTYQEVILNHRIQRPRRRMQKMIVQATEALFNSPRTLLPPDKYQSYKEQGEDRRLLCDYIAGMTDRYLTQYHHEIFGN